MANATLVVSRKEARKCIQAQIDEGRELLDRYSDSTSSVVQFVRETDKWSSDNRKLLKRLFSDDSLADEYLRGTLHRATGVSGEEDSRHTRLEATRNTVTARLSKLASIRDSIRLFALTPHLADRRKVMLLLQPLIREAENVPGTHNSLELDALRQRADMILRNLFGEASSYVSSLRSIEIHEWSSAVADGAYTIKCRESRARILNLLIAIYEEVKTFGLRSEETVKPQIHDEESKSATAVARRNNEEDGDPRNVFVVHGRNKRATQAMFEFLRSIGLHPIEWEETVRLTGETAPYVGQILDAGFSNARAVVVLLTPDDEAQLREAFRKTNDSSYEVELTPQARPNVLFEAGMAMGRHPKTTIFVEIDALGPVRPFSDVSGRHTVRWDDSVAKREDLARRLETAGCQVNLDGSDWRTAGRFPKTRKTRRDAKIDAGASSPASEEPFKVSRLDAESLKEIEDHYQGQGFITVFPHLADKDNKLALGYALAYVPGTRREVWAGYSRGEYEHILMLKPPNDR